MDLTNNKEFINKLNDDIESLSKTLYLDNPDLWLDFLEKSSDKNFDEMGLFFAAKYNFLSIIKYAVEKNNFDLKNSSKNKAFNSIKNHLLDVARTEGSYDVLAYLSGENKVEVENKTKLSFECTENHSVKFNNDYVGSTYNCPHCNSNIFQFGYNVFISSTCTYSVSHRKLIRSNPKELDTIVCASCKKEIPEITPTKLENILNIENCITCSTHLPTSGILKEVIVNFNKDHDVFEDDKSIYCCKSCRKPLENVQLQHFNLI
ncbi:MAG: hypothetical protein RSD77_04460 [Romboutsia sp.]